MARPASAPRLRVGVARFTSCGGCQLTLAGLHEALLAVADRVDIVEFAEVLSPRSAGPYDLLLVEGSVSTPDQARRIGELRRQARLLVTIGACATTGGIQALRNWSDGDVWRAAVYPQPEFIHALRTSTPISEHVTVDALLRGCPIDPGQLAELLTAILVGRRAQLLDATVCLECKARGTVCLISSEGAPCLGPVTKSGCGAICPAFGRACYGCFGPAQPANVEALRAQFQAQGRSDEEIGRLFAGFTANAPAFRTAARPPLAVLDQPPVGPEPAGRISHAFPGIAPLTSAGGDDARH
jgi:coenzyme F420-reducing hydrogenase gamma subunit